MYDYDRSVFFVLHLYDRFDETMNEIQSNIMKITRSTPFSVWRTFFIASYIDSRQYSLVYVRILKFEEFEIEFEQVRKHDTFMGKSRHGEDSINPFYDFHGPFSKGYNAIRIPTHFALFVIVWTHFYGVCLFLKHAKRL